LYWNTLYNIRRGGEGNHGDTSLTMLTGRGFSSNGVGRTLWRFASAKGGVT
jgi:hypothetical protein